MKLSTYVFLLLLGAGIFYFKPALLHSVIHKTEALQAMPVHQGDVPSGGYARVTRNGLSPALSGWDHYSPSDEVKQLTQTHRIYGQTWHSYTPPGSEAAPVILLLHGAGRSGLSMIEMWQKTAQEQDLILIAPNALGSHWEVRDLSHTALQNALSSSTLGRPAGKVFLFGHSNGAVFASQLINRAQGPWKAAAMHGGFAPAEAFQPAAEAKPVRLYLGDRDHIFTTPEAERTGKSMAKSGHRFTLQLIPGHTHWFYEIGPAIADDSWTWFRSLDE